MPSRPKCAEEKGTVSRLAKVFLPGSVASNQMNQASATGGEASGARIVAYVNCSAGVKARAS
jgi:quinolinate synthase